jgi:hypothetical protein
MVLGLGYGQCVKFENFVFELCYTALYRMIRSGTSQQSTTVF